MPLYEYNCRDCRRDYELLIRGAEQPICPTCGGKHLEKLLSVPAAPGQASGSGLPMCRPMPAAGGCGLPQCGSGGCQGMD